MPLAKSIYWVIFLTLEHVFRVRFPTPDMMSCWDNTGYKTCGAGHEALYGKLCCLQSRPILLTVSYSVKTYEYISVPIFQGFSLMFHVFRSVLVFCICSFRYKGVVENISKECQSCNSLPADVRIILHFNYKAKCF